MIKAIKELDEHTWNKVNERLQTLPDASSWFCRFTHGELKRAAEFIAEHGLAFTAAQERFFRARFNTFEMSILAKLNNTTGEKFEATVQQVKSAVQKTERYIASIAEEIDHDRQIAEFTASIKKNKGRLAHKETDMRSSYDRLKEIFE